MQRHKLIAALLVIEAVLLSGVAAWYFCPWARSNAETIKVTHAPPRSLGLTEGATVFTSLDDLRREYPAAKVEFGRPVDFDRENIVRVAWSDKGPLNAHLDWTSRWGGSSIRFYVNKPPTNYATFIMMTSVDWFVVPRAAEVHYDGLLQPLARDAVMLVLVAVTIGGSLLAANRRWALQSAARGAAATDDDRGPRAMGPTRVAVNV
jgi:hypothetical protein